MLDDDKPPLTEALLTHHGVKGMHWGVVNKDKPTGRRPSKGSPPKDPHKVAKENESTKEYISLATKARQKKPTPEQAAKSIRENQEKFLQKFEPSEADPKKGLSPERKSQLKKAAIGVAVLGAVAAAAYYGNKKGVFDNLPGRSENVLYNPDTIAKMSGKPISVNQYRNNVMHSQAETWSGMGRSYITEKSFARPEITLPAGHKFHRISTAAESTFGRTTYSTASVEDFNRYATSFAGISNNYKGPLHHVTFNTTSEFKVPSLHTVLETAREVMAREGDMPESLLTKEYALKWYQANSGSSWDLPRGKALFEALKEKGYHAIVDEMDHGVQGDLPLVIFNTENLTAKAAQIMSSGDLKQAQRSVTELLDRKL